MAFIMESEQKRLLKKADELMKQADKTKHLAELVRVFNETKTTTKIEMRAFVSGGSNISVIFDQKEAPNAFRSMKDQVLYALEMRIENSRKELGIKELFITINEQEPKS